MKQLKKLNLSCNKIKSFPNLKENEKLEILILDRNPITKINSKEIGIFHKYM